MIVETDLRNTRPSAREISFSPSGSFTATNVQDAIVQASTIGGGGGGGGVVSRVVTFGMSPYTPIASDSILLVNTAGGPITINMPPHASRAGTFLTVKDDTGNAAANPISIFASAGETIDGQSPYTVDSAFNGVRLGPQTGGYFVDA